VNLGVWGNPRICDWIRAALKEAKAGANKHDQTLDWLSGVLHGKFEHAYRPRPASGDADGSRNASFLLVMLPDGRGYLIPSDDRRLAVAGLGITNPQFITSAVGRRLLALGLRLGLAQRLLPRVRMIAPPEASVLEQVERVLNLGPLHTAISLGTPGHIREPVLQLMSAQGETLGYAKVDWTERGAIRHEAEMLKTLPSFRPTSFLYPVVLYAGTLGDRYVCVTAAEAQPDVSRRSTSLLFANSRPGIRRGCPSSRARSGGPFEPE